MKKQRLYIGLGYLLSGLLLGALAVKTTQSGSAISSILWGLAGGATGGALSLLVRYCYWTRPQNRERYQERLEQEAIDLRDERKEMLRNRAGRHAYLAGLLVIAVSIPVLSVLNELGVLEHTRMLILYLGGYAVFQLAAGILIYRRLSRKY